MNFTIIVRLLLFFLLTISIGTHELFASFPVVRNFTKKAYKGGTQNWDIAQDTTGMMYFANKYGVLSFDGSTWGLHQLDNYGEARSLAVDDKAGRIYAGGSNTFGYFEADSNSGAMTFRSLIPTLTEKSKTVGDIWNVLRQGNNWWFQGDYDLFKYDGRTSQIFPIGSKIVASGLIDGKITFATEDGRIYRMEGSMLKEVSDRLAGLKVTSILQHPASSRKGLVVTAFSGCFALDGENVYPVSLDVDPILKESQVFCAAIKDNKIIFGTVNRGLIIKDIASGRNTFISRESGMQNNTVLSADFDRQGNIWLGLDNGIDFVNYNSPVRELLPSNASFGTGYVSELWGDRLLLGTNQGLYSVRYPFAGMSDASPANELHGQIWAITKIGSELIVSTDFGLFAGAPGSWRKIGDIGGALNVTPLDNSGIRIIVSSYNGYFLVEKKSDVWSVTGSITGFDQSNCSLKIDRDGYLWAMNWMNGIFRMKFNYSERRFTDLKHYTEREGLPSIKNNGVDIINGKPVISTIEGFYTPSADGKKMVPSSYYNGLFPFHSSARLTEAPDGSLWAVSLRNMMRASRRGNGISIDSTSYSSVPRNLVPGYVDFNFLPDAVILSNENGFYELNPQMEGRGGWRPQLLLSRVTVNGDSIIYEKNGIIDARRGISFPHNIPSVRFEVTYPEFREEDAVEYSFMLEGYDKGWSPYSSSPFKEYSQIGHGHYILKVRARDRYNNTVTESEFPIEVATPWYLSTVALIIYFIMVIAAGTGLARLFTSMSKKTAMKIEAEKEEEIKEIKNAALQESMRKDSEIESLQTSKKEQEISHRSESLSNVTMNVVQKNELLIKISEKLEGMRSEMVLDSSQNAMISRDVDSIQNMIKQAVQAEKDQIDIARNFEGVYGDYADRLITQYPDLTKSELRLCCFIKMGLTTKEIAPLQNVTPKTIEMSRYRLRKKLRLERADSLSDYLCNF